MATLSLSFDTGAVPLSRIQDAFASAYSYSPTLPDGSANPETKALFTRRKIKEYIVEAVRGQDADAATKAALAGVAGITLT